ncbi:MAG TPA: universal stress protein [Nitrososphaeraceae archaeon]
MDSSLLDELQRESDQRQVSLNVLVNQALKRYRYNSIGSRGFSASKDFLLGRVSYKIMHYAKCPVVVVR